MKAIKKCRVCKTEFEACSTQRVTENMKYNWRSVCCSPACGAIDLERILESRGNKKAAPKELSSEPQMGSSG